MTTKKKALSSIEQAFVREYLIDLNAVQAAVRAGYTKSTAESKSYLWVARTREECPADKQHVWDAINEAKLERTKRVNIDADYVLLRHSEIDQLDPIEILNDDGSVKPLSQWPKSWRVSISAIEVMELANAESETEVRAIMKKIKWPDKLKNLEVMGNHVGVQAYRTQTKHEGEIIVFDSDYGDRNQN